MAVGGTVEVALQEIKRMIKDLTLMPGQPLRQEVLAAELSVSRAPLREALRVLQSEGIVVHTANVGYSVRRLSASDLQQVYSMREVLENLLVKSIPEDARLPIDELSAMNNELRRLAEAANIDKMRDLNEVWHFTLFGLSPLHLVRHEVARLWELSHAYRSYYLYDERARFRVVEEHGRIIQALADRDWQQVAAISQEHRRVVPSHIGRMDAGISAIGSHGSTVPFD